MKMYTITIYNGTSVKTVTTSNRYKVRTYRRAFERIVSERGLTVKASTSRGIWTSNGPSLEIWAS